MSRRKPSPQPSSFAKLFRSFGHSHPPYRIFSDFCTLSAVSISNSMREFQPPEVVERREKDYLACAKRYTKDELTLMAQMLAAVTLALERNPNQDFLGNQYMEIDLGNDRIGQIFTPYHVSAMMAKMQMADAAELLKTKRYISISDPCVGGGAMLIAAYNAAGELGINPQTQCLFYGTDIDATVLRMAYIQCSLLGMCGHFTHGNSLSVEVWDTLSTPLFYLNAWRFGRQERAEWEMDDHSEDTLDMVQPAIEDEPEAVDTVVEMPVIEEMWGLPTGRGAVQQLRLF